MSDFSSGLGGRAAIITGAAQGIGAGIARRLAAEGVLITVADIQEDKGKALADELGSRDKTAMFVKTDVSREDELAQLVETAVASFGSLDIIVNSAAPPRNASISLGDSLASWDAEQALLLRSHLMIADKALPHLAASGHGCIIGIASVLAWAVGEQTCTYHVAKAGLVQATRYLAAHFGPEGVRVNCVCPGIVDRDEGPRLTDDPINRAVAQVAVPLGRAGLAVDVANAVAFLCSDQAAYITGHSLVVDGGLTLGEPFSIGRQSFRRALAESDQKQWQN